MSCKLKNSNPSRVPIRSNFDRQMIRKYNSKVLNSIEHYNSPPWPTQRTEMDQQQYQVYCSKSCSEQTPEYYNSPPYPTRRSNYDQLLHQKFNPQLAENYDLNYVNPRTKYDMNMRSEFCNICPPNTVEGYQDREMTLHDPYNSWSYTTTYIG